MDKRYDLNRGTIHRAYAEDIYPTLDPGSVRLVISDGPYGMRKAAWDMMNLDDLPAWYAPHIEAWGRACMPSASVYLWNTAAGWARLDPVMRASGWTFRGLITWDKGGTPAVLSRGMADVTESCGVYTRGDAAGPSLTHVWRPSPSAYAHEKLRGEDVLTSVKDGYQWAAPLHPCQEPLTFSDRMIRASSKPGDLVLEPFGGTLRVAVACERMEPSEARRYVCVEPDEDGRDYIAAVLPSLRLEFKDEDKDGQRGLFS